MAADDDKDAFGRAMRLQGARIAATGDQQLQEFREVYTRCDADERAAFRQAADLAQQSLDILRKLPANFLTVKIEVSNSITDPETGEEVYDGGGKFAPKVLLKAFDAWDKGEEFAPGGLGFIS
jgi:hypothetical protein